MQNDDSSKYQKRSLSILPDLYERAKAKAKSMRPKTSVSAYIVSLIEKDLDEKPVDKIKGQSPSVDFSKGKRKGLSEPENHSK